MKLADRLKLFPGGLPELARLSGLDLTSVYRFVWRSNRRLPVAIASKLSSVIRSRRRGCPRALRQLGDVERLLEAWKSTAPSSLFRDQEEA